MKRNAVVAPIVIGAVLLAGFFVLRGQPKTVEVIQAQRRDVTRTLAVTGQVEAITNTTVSSVINGIQVLKVLADKGDRVSAGQPLVILDDRELRAATAKAEAQSRVSEANALKAGAALRSSLANLKKIVAQAGGAARSSALAKEALNESIDLKTQRDQASASVLTSRERLAQAKENAARTRAGARQQAIRSSQAEVRRIESQLKLALLTRDRSKSLLDQGATSQAEYDLALANSVALSENLIQAKEQTSQLEIPRTEDVKQAEANEREAEAALKGSETGLLNAERAYKNRIVLRQQANLSQTEQSTTSASIAAAEAEAQQAKAGVVAAEADSLQSRANIEQARAQLAKTILRSPVDGIVTDRKVEPGETVPNSKVLFAIATPKRLRIKADIDETNLHDIHIGQRAVIAPDAYPKLRLEGKVVEIVPAANSDRGTVEVRIAIADQSSPIVPQLTADVNLYIGFFPKALTLPRDSVIDPDSNPKSRVVSNGKIVEKRIKLQYGDVGNVMIEEGIDENDQILVNPTAAKPGEEVKPKLVKQEPKS